MTPVVAGRAERSPAPATTGARTGPSVRRPRPRRGPGPGRAFAGPGHDGGPDRAERSPAPATTGPGPGPGVRIASRATGASAAAGCGSSAACASACTTDGRSRARPRAGSCARISCTSDGAIHEGARYVSCACSRGRYARSSPSMARRCAFALASARARAMSRGRRAVLASWSSAAAQLIEAVRESAAPAGYCGGLDQRQAPSGAVPRVAAERFGPSRRAPTAPTPDRVNVSRR
jgi:hypothetical protein